MDNMSTVGIIREYCTSKGFDAGRLSAREAIRSQLEDENNGFAHPNITKDTKVFVRLLDINQIVIYNEPHYYHVEARPIVSHSGAPLIAGVVFEYGQNYRLIDGYHRLKWLHDEGVEQATYIVLSNP